MALTGNPAFALRNILQHVAGSGAQTVLEGWETTLHAKGATLQFAQRHGEVVGLFNRVYERLLALPPEADGRGQYMEYLPHWYQAIVFRHNWGNTGQPASNVCDAQVISQLTGLGYAFDLHSVTAPAPSNDAIARLKESLVEWEEILADAEIDQRLANELRAHVNRLKFLLDDEVLQTFGTEPVVDGGRNLLGAALPAISRVPVRIAKKMTVAMVAVAGILHGAHTALDDANALLQGAETLREHVIELTGPAGQLEQKKPPALGPGEQPQEGNAEQNTIDGEIVDDKPKPGEKPKG
ncbi:hypothetical protein [Mycobacterium sp. Aquia_213]|uniref:hypothetical protein n=1 Tax=Mycobacterium sp. Aquia_213 TaxID=2991728 RepID=UPI002270907B|nr:hypothetical protein [Mycobacterium sp. Aquia_213]WAC93572.1 hypothetical protein LMQ14_10790 [Mycobacterium sp. Aquia_213]